MDLLVLSEDDVARLLDLDELLDALATGFRALSEGQVEAPPRNGVTLPHGGFLLAMPGWLPGMPIGVKLVSVFHHNVPHGLPGHQALISLFDAETGTPVAILDGTHITALRTAGGAALSTRLLAPPDARVLAIVGAGVQGRSHLRLLPRVRDFAEIRIASRNPADAERLAASDPRARAVASIAEAVAGADVICLCTASGTPVIEAEWVKAGAHVTSVGFAPPGGELPRPLIPRGRLFVETRQAFNPPPAGCGELSGLDPSTGTELGEVLLGRHPGRGGAEEITIYKSMGHAMEDLVAADLVHRRARASGVGQRVTLGRGGAEH